MQAPQSLRVSVPLIDIGRFVYQGVPTALLARRLPVIRWCDVRNERPIVSGLRFVMGALLVCRYGRRR
jgi:hypothetical protein